jgi:hypothetical protein
VSQNFGSRLYYRRVDRYAKIASISSYCNWNKNSVDNATQRDTDLLFDFNKLNTSDDECVMVILHDVDDVDPNVICSDPKLMTMNSHWREI